MKELIEKQTKLCQNIDEARGLYYRKFGRVADVLFLTPEHWTTVFGWLSESECHKTRYSNIRIEITKCSNVSYFSSSTASLIMTVKNVGFESEKVKHLFDKE